MYASEPEEEYRQANDGKWYTKEQFMHYYTSIDPWKAPFGSWRDRWGRAKRKPAAPAASAPQEELRQADDNQWYTEEEFKSFYGNGPWKWQLGESWTANCCTCGICC